MQFRQMTIFDYLKPSSGIEEMAAEEIARIVGEQLGLVFQRTRFGDFECKTGGMTFEIAKETYLTNDEYGKAFIGVGWNSNHAGGGAPVDSIEDAVQYFRFQMEKRAREA